MADYLDDPHAQPHLPVPTVWQAQQPSAASEAKVAPEAEAEAEAELVAEHGHPAFIPATQLQKQHFDIIVVGAGVAGASLAYALGRSGRHVAVVERDWSEPDRIVGELLQPGGVRALACLDLLGAMQGIQAVPVRGYEVFHAGQNNQSVHIPYPSVDAVQALPPGARGLVSDQGQLEGRAFHHGRFLQMLRARALQQKTVTCIEATVRSLEEDPRGGHITGVHAVRKTVPAHDATKVSEDSGNGEQDNVSNEATTEDLQLRADVTIIADGIFSKFRAGYGTTIKPQVRSHFIGLEIQHAPMPRPYHGHVVLAPSGPVLLYQIAEDQPKEDDDQGVHTTRILIDFPGERNPSVSKGNVHEFIRENVVPYLPGGLGTALQNELDLIEQGLGTNRLRRMPNSWLPPSVQGQSRFRRGCITVGDAMNMRHPLTGGGMTVAFWDVVHLTNILRGGSGWVPEWDQLRPARMLDLARWDTQVRPALLSWHWARKNVASVINILALALYSLFSTDGDDNLLVLREGCFAYFQRGGKWINEPVRLLSATTPAPLLLVYHFFNVALYSVYALFSLPQVHDDVALPRHIARWSEYPRLTWRSMGVLYTALWVFCPIVWTECKMNKPDFSHMPRKAGGFVPPDAKGAASFFRFLLLTCVVIIAFAWSFFDPVSKPERFRGGVTAVAKHWGQTNLTSIATA